MRRRAAAVVVFAIGVVLVAACSGASPRTLPPPSSTSSTLPEPTTSSIDLSQVPLATVAGQPTTTIVDTGDAVLAGVVRGPEGAVPGAVVRVERLVGSRVVPLEVRTGEDGRWTIQGLPGGRFRVRAHLTPRLTMTEPAVFFLADGEARDVPLDLSPYEGLEVLAGTTPSVTFPGDAISLAVQVGERFVGDDGVGRSRPLPGVAVRVLVTGWRTIDDGTSRPTTTTTTRPDDDDGTTTTTQRFSTTTTTEPRATAAVTDASGQVVLTFACDRVTPVSATALVGEDRQSFTLDVPDCIPVPTTTTAPPPEPDPDATTTTNP